MTTPHWLLVSAPIEVLWCLFVSQPHYLPAGCVVQHASDLMNAGCLTSCVAPTDMADTEYHWEACCLPCHLLV